jgi:type I restriction enzyme R subunit
MQAIARVNRVYKDKPAGLIVDYIGIAEHLRKALAMYGSEITNDDLLPLEEVVVRMKVLHKKVAGFFGDLVYSGWRKKKGDELSSLMREAIDSVITDARGAHSDDRKMEYFGAVSTLSKLHAFVMPEAVAMEMLSDMQFFQAVKESIAKLTVVPKAVFPEETESAIRSLITGAVQAEDIIDLFRKDGERGSVSIFDPHFEEEIKKVRFKNLAVDVVRKLLDKEIVSRMKKNKARYETMLDTLKNLIEKYENNVIDSAEIIKQLVEIALEIKKLDQEGQESGLSEEEIVFYDTLVRDPYLKEAGIDIKNFVRDLISRIRRDLAIDWTNNDVIKARIRQNVRLLLIQKGIIEQAQTERLIESIYQETIRVYREYIPA